MSSLERWLVARQEDRRGMRGRRPKDPKRAVTTWREEELLDGEVVIKSKGRKIAEVDGAGAILGEISALLSTPHVATVTASRQSTCYVIQDFMKFIFEHPDACVSVAQVLAVRLVNMNNHFVQVKEQIESLQGELENYLPIFPETSP